MANPVLAAIDAANRRITFLYDAAGNQTTVIDYSGGRTTTAYDAAGQVASITKPTGDRTTFIYDSAGRQTETIDYQGGRTTTVYDAAGQAIGTVNALGKRTTTVFDDAGQVIGTVDQLGNRTTSVYDAAGNRTLYQDALNNRTTFVYDSLNREIEQIDPHGQSVTFAYDSAGFMTSTTDRLGRRRDFSYDDVGRNTGETWIAADGSTVVDRITFTYDAAGNQLTAANGAGAYTFTYDDVNQVSTVQEPFGLSLTFTWDALSRRTKVEDSLGGVTTSVYDVLGRLESRKFGGTSQTPLRIDLTYTVEGQQESFTRYSDLSGTTKVATTSFTYDAAQRLTNLHHFDGSNNNIANYTYTYDAHSRLTAERRNGTATTYTYDDTDQVTADGTNNFTYDAEGNRTNEGYSTGTGNQLTSDGTWNYTYDDEGNLTKKVKISDGKTWTYSYDHRNQITQVQRRTTDGGTLELDVDFKYDAYGNRVEKTIDSDGDGDVDTTQRYALDGWNPGKSSPIGNENWDVFADLNGSNELETRYLRGDIVDQIFARTAANGDAYWYLGDHLGSIRDITDNTGAVKDTLSYDAFGNIISESDANYGGRYKWTGREIDQEIELQYNRARYYDAKTGRWLNQDPLGFDAGDSNLYRYVKNKPTNHIDPSGMREADDHPANPLNRKLVDVTLKVEGLINRVLSLEAYQATSGKDFTEKVFDRFGKNQPGTGIAGLGEIAKIAYRLEDKNTGFLKEKSNEIAFIPFRKSKYRNNKLFGRPVGALEGDGPPGFLNLMTANHMMAPTILINDVPIGLDKLEHFFQQGYWLWWYSNYTEIYSDGTKSLLLKNKNDRFAFSAFMEGIDPSKIIPGCKGLDEKVLLKMAKSFEKRFNQKGYYGSYASGIVSVTDMYANESGYEFYETLYQTYVKWSKDGNPGLLPTIKIFKGVHNWSETVHPNLYVGTIFGKPIFEDNKYVK